MRHGEQSNWGWALATLAAVLLCAGSAQATLVVADFNDIAAGTIGGKGGGTGFTGTWTGSAGGTVVSGDLTSSLYTLTQSGTAQHYRSINSTGLRQNYRTLAASPTGTVWFSFLAMAEATGDRAGVSFNPPTATPFADTGTVYAHLVGTALNYQFGTGTAGTVPGVATLGTSTLIVGEMVIAGSGGVDSIRLWANPDLVANPDINAYTPIYSNATVNFIDSITHIGAVAARADTASTGGGNVDAIRISDGGGNVSQAYSDVVPEPGSLVLLGGAVVALLGRRRRAVA